MKYKLSLSGGMNALDKNPNALYAYGLEHIQDLTNLGIDFNGEIKEDMTLSQTVLPKTILIFFKI